MLKTQEEFERTMEDYFWVYGPDLESFQLEYVVEWEYVYEDKTLVFSFDDEYKMDAFYDKLKDCPKNDESFEIDWYDGIDRKNKTLTIKSIEGGL